MTVTIISRHSKTIHKLVEEQMKKEAQELGLTPGVILFKKSLNVE